MQLTQSFVIAVSFSPDQLRFVNDRSESGRTAHYNSLPHLVVPVVTIRTKVILALRWVVMNGEALPDFAKVGVRNIGTFNSRRRTAPAEPELELR